MTVEAPPTSLYGLLQDYQRQLSDGYEPVVQSVYSRFKDVEARAQERLRELNTLIDEARLAGKEPTRHWLYQQDRYQRLVTDLENDLLAIQEVLRDGVHMAQQRAITLGSSVVKDAYGLVADLPVGIERSFSTFPTEAAQQIILMAEPGPVRRVLEKYSATGAQAAADALIRGVSLGYDTGRISRDLRSSLGISAIRATTIARTETMRAFREASRLTMMANPDILEGWVWESSRQKNTCAVCWGMHGTLFQFNSRVATQVEEIQPVVRSTGPPKDPALKAALDRWYDFDYGSAIRQASRGQSLKGFETPGGETITDAEAAQLEADAALIQHEAGRKRALNTLYRGEILDDMDAFERRFGASTFKTNSLTAATPNEEMSRLYYEREGMPEGAVRVQIRYRDEGGVRGQVRAGFEDAEPETIIPRGAQFTVASRTQRPDGSWLVELQGDAGTPGGDRALPNPLMKADGPVKAPSGSTAPPGGMSQPISVDEASQRGLIPMYTHPNCRCVMTPRPKSYADILGDPSIPDNRPPILSGEDAFSKLAPAAQRHILGPGRFAHYQNGMPLRDMLTARADKDWGIVRGLKPVGSTRSSSRPST